MEEYGLISVEINGQIQQVQAYKRQNGFNPMTGEPVIEMVIRDGFDPMTGEPAYTAVVQDGFDPMTGAPVFKMPQEEVQAPAEPPVNQIVESVKGDVVQLKQSAAAAAGKRRATAPKKAAKVPTAAVVGGIAAVVVVVLVIAVVSLLGSKQAKILKAVNNTIAEDTFGSVLMDSAKVMSSDEITVDVAGSVYAYGDGGEVTGSLAADTKDAKIGFNGSFNIAGVSQEANFYYDDSKVQFALPSISSSVYEYDYTKKNTGALADLIEDTTNGSIEDVNTLLSGAAKAMKKSSDYKDKSTKAMVKALSDIKIEKIKAEKFEVDGKDRKCDGYAMTITEKDVKNVASAMADAREKVYGDIIEEMMEAVENLTGERMPDMDDIVDEIELDEDIEIEFYIYKKALAAVSINVDDEELLIEFKGGDNRTSNIVVSADGNEILERESEMSGKTEEGAIIIDGTKVKYSYDKSTGDLMINPGMKIKANYLVKGNSISFTMDENLFGVSVDGSVNISKGSRAQALKGNIFDIGNADQTDIQGEVMDIVSELGIY